MKLKDSLFQSSMTTLSIMKLKGLFQSSILSIMKLKGHSITAQTDRKRQMKIISKLLKKIAAEKQNKSE